MARPRKPLARQLGVYVEAGLAEAIEAEIAARGIDKRIFFEAAARQELANPTTRREPTQEALAIGA